MDEVFWIDAYPPARLAIVARPQGDNWLDDEMRRIRTAGVETVVSLLERDEARFLGLADEQGAAARAGIRFLSYPIPDVHVPLDREHFSEFVEGLAEKLRAGISIGVHCRGCIGRSTVTAACALIHLGWEPAEAVRAVREARGCPVPDTPEQLEWILNYKAPDLI